IRLSWSSASKLKEVVPQSQLLPDAPTGLVWFKNPTDTIQITGQPVITNEATFEVRVLFPGNKSAYGSVFGASTLGQESKAVSIGPTHVFAGSFATNRVEQDVNMAFDQWH